MLVLTVTAGSKARKWLCAVVPREAKEKREARRKVHVDVMVRI